MRISNKSNKAAKIYKQANMAKDKNTMKRDHQEYRMRVTVIVEGV